MYDGLKMTYGNLEDFVSLYNYRACKNAHHAYPVDGKWYTTMQIDLKGTHTESAYKISGRNAPKFVYGLEVVSELKWNDEGSYYDIDIIRISTIVYNHWEGCYYYLEKTDGTGVNIKDTNRTHAACVCKSKNEEYIKHGSPNRYFFDEVECGSCEY